MDSSKSARGLGVLAGANSVFSVARTRSLFSFTSFFQARVSGVAAPHTSGSAIFITLVIFTVLSFILSTLASILTRSEAPAGGDQAEEAEAPEAEGAGKEQGDSGSSATAATAFKEKEFTNIPHGLQEDIYGMGIAAIIRDTQRFAMKTEKYALRASRLSITIMVLVFTMSLQVFLMYEMKHLVTSVSTREARDVYDQYEVVMYNNNVTKSENGFSRGIDGAFDISRFAKLDDDTKDNACQMPLSQPTFFIGIILIWTLVCVAEIRRAVNLGGSLLWYTPTIASMEHACEDTPETGDEAVIVTGLTMTVKGIIAGCILLPRIIVSVVLLWLGCRWLAGTMGFGDVLQNAVTLEFILLLKDVFYNTMAPHHNKIETRNTMILPNESKSNPNAPTFLGAFLWGLVSVFWVMLYVECFQSVLPEYNWDIHDACVDYLASVQGRDETATGF
jgi:hypothetical protein